MKEEGVSLLRSRFGFTRTTGRTGGGATVSDSAYISPNTDRRQQLFLKKLQYFNSNSSLNTNNQNCNNDSKLRTHSRVIVNNSFNTARENSNFIPNLGKFDRSKSVTKTVSKVSPKEGSQVKAPLSVTKYSPYRGETQRQSSSSSSTPLIMTAESGQQSKKNGSKLQSSFVPTKSPSSMSAMQKPSQLPGLRASFLNSDNSRLTSASLHSRSYGYQHPSHSPRQEKDKPKQRKFVSYKKSEPASLEPANRPSVQTKVEVTPKSRKWLAKKTEEKEKGVSECLNKLRLSNKMMLEQQSFQPISQETDLCEDCTGETEEDSGIFTSSHSKYSLDDEMIESDDPPADSPRDSGVKDIKNFSSDSDDMCSRETSPMQLLADLLRKTPDTNMDQTDGNTSKHNKSSLVKLRKQQFEQDIRNNREIHESNRSFVSRGSSTKLVSKIDFNNISNIPDHISRPSQSCEKEIKKSPSKESSGVASDLASSRMESSLVSNSSRLSVCTDCTASSEENENKFFDDDYNDQQQLILNSQQEQSYDETLFAAVDSLLQDNQDREQAEGDQIQRVQVQRVQQIMQEEKGRDRKVSVDTLSSLESDICMLDLDDGLPPSEDTPDDSRSNSPASPDLLLSDVASVRKLLIQLQALLSQSQAEKTERTEEENSDLKSELAVLRLQLAERDRKIETLERKLEYSKSRSLHGLSNIATQTQAASQLRPKPRPLSWDLTSISLVRNFNNL